jgi:curved DNA-binding protein
MAEKDLYSVLDVAKTASDEEIRRAYRKLARKLHPDLNPGNKAAEERFKEMSAAYDVLSDPEKRKLYDEFGHDGLRSGFDAEQARAYRSWQESPRGGGRPFSEQFADQFGGGFDFGDLFGGMSGFRAGGMRGEDVVAVVELDLAKALEGTEVSLRLPSSGARGGPEEVVTVRIPPGAEDGSRLVVKGRGAPGSGKAPPGDLIIETRVRPHPHFRREGLDLYLDLPVTLDEAYSGAEVDVPTPGGSVKLRIPERSQQGRKLRLRGKGVAKGAGRGDLYVILDVRLPEREDPALAEALRRARADYATPVREGISL